MHAFQRQGGEVVPLFTDSSACCDVGSTEYSSRYRASAKRLSSSGRWACVYLLARYVNIVYRRVRESACVQSSICGPTRLMAPDHLSAKAANRARASVKGFSRTRDLSPASGKKVPEGSADTSSTAAQTFSH